jgi:DNA-directed RNA polymerase specialized sigma24 family protein
MMRIFGGTSSERSWLCGILKNQICEALRISRNNLWVMLYWARMALREWSRVELVREEATKDVEP